MNNLKELVEMFIQSGNNIAFQNEKGQISYSKLYQDILVFSTKLNMLSNNRPRVALIADNSYEWVVGLLGTLYSNGIVTIIDSIEAIDNIIFKIMHSDSNIVCYSKNEKIDCLLKCEAVDFFISITSDEKNNILLFNHPEVLSRTKILETNRDNEGVSVLMYTSGTTGNPKGVMLSQENLIAVIIAAQNDLVIGERLLLTLPMSHCYGCVLGVLAPLFKGITVYISQGVKFISKELKEFQPDTLMLVPALIEYIYVSILSRLPQKNILTAEDKNAAQNMLGGRLKSIISGGAHLLDQYIFLYNELGVSIYNGYGMTECSPLISVNNAMYNKVKTVGKCTSCCKIHIDSDKGDCGEIWVKGKNVSKGYYKNINETRKAFCGEWFKTGDIGYMDADGYLSILGRVKNLIVFSNGNKVCPEELEELIMKQIGISDILVEGLEAETGNTVIRVLIYQNEIDERHRNSILLKINELNDELPKYKRIKKIEFVDKPFEKTSTGKIRRTYLTQEQIRARLVTILVNSFANKNTFMDIDDLIKEFNFDSLGLYHFIALIEEEFKIGIEEFELEEFFNMEKAIKNIYNKVNK